jgi:hypothetical protein
MNGLPEDFDAGVFIGETLDRIAFYAYVIYFGFGDGLGVNLESSFAYKEDELAQAMQYEVPVTSSGVMTLIGKRVVEVEASRDGTLRVVFEGGATLTFFDSLKTFESYQIRIGPMVIAV